MSEGGKRNLFGRVFGGAKSREPAVPEEEKRPPEVQALNEPFPADQAPAEQGPPGEAPPQNVSSAEISAEPDGETAQEKRNIFGRLFTGKTREPGSSGGFPPEPPAAEPTPAEHDPQEAAAPGEGAQDKGRIGWFQRLRQGLTRTSSRLTEGITGVFTKRKLDDETLEELEDLLIQADLGLDVASGVAAALKKARYNSDITPEEVRTILAQEVEKVLAPVARPLEIDAAKKPFVVLVVGVNGTGKTTTIGKYASQFAKQGLRVMLAAGDTFRAAAIEQLKIWGERTGAEVVASELGADAAGLAFDALQRAKDEAFDLLLIDTAGRLQNKTALMAELEKVIRVIKKLDSTAPHSVVLTLDATTGQNALSQVDIFGKTAGVTGLVMTKLDGTARGGILVALSSKYGLPVHAIGVGESAADLQPFRAHDFARAIAGVA